MIKLFCIGSKKLLRLVEYSEALRQRKNNVLAYEVKSTAVSVPVPDGLGLGHDGVQLEQVVDGPPAAGRLRPLLRPVRGGAVTRLQGVLAWG